MQMAAALAYYTVFSLPPMLFVVVSVAGMFVERENVTAQVERELTDVVGEAGSEQVIQMLQESGRSRSGWIAGGVSLLLLLFGATGAVVQLKASLNQTWNVPESQQASGLTGFLLSRLLSLAMVLTVAFIMMISVVATTIIEHIQRQAADRLPGRFVGTFVETAHWGISFAIVTILFAAMYKWLPDCTVEWRNVWFGAIVTGVLMTIAKSALGRFLGGGALESAYGAAGALVLILTWVYYASIVFLFGAELTQSRQRMRQEDEAAATDN